METFSGRFWEIPGNVLKLELLKVLIDHKTPRYSSKQSLECLPEVFLTDEPNTKEKKNKSEHSAARKKIVAVEGIPHIIFGCPLWTDTNTKFSVLIRSGVSSKYLERWCFLTFEGTEGLSTKLFRLFLHYPGRAEFESTILPNWYKKINIHPNCFKNGSSEQGYVSSS